eukprot:TRINITY_DN15551_c0_g1_i1.p1 TRINITY_DN15551_c0_g1~~TRINITY_DN15551_c0_g1_i1.p1  ORF type:complete len:526 (+),score=132.47 TRINITY_DN15551_c0_g1_i1:63-1640(+)
MYSNGRPRASSFGGRQYVRRMKEIREREDDDRERERGRQVQDKRKEIFMRYSSMPVKGLGEVRAFGDPPDVRELRRRKEPVVIDNRSTEQVKRSVTQLRDIDKQRIRELEEHRASRDSPSRMRELGFSSSIPPSRDGTFGHTPPPPRSRSATRLSSNLEASFTTLRGIDEFRRQDSLKRVESVNSPMKQKEMHFTPVPSHVNNGIPPLEEFHKVYIEGVTLATNVRSKVFDWPAEQKAKMQRDRERATAETPPQPSISTPRGRSQARRESVATTGSRSKGKSREGEDSLDIPPPPSPPVLKTPAHRKKPGSPRSGTPTTPKTTPRRMSRDVSHLTDVNISPVPQPRYMRCKTPPSSSRKKKNEEGSPHDDLIKRLQEENAELRANVFRMQSQLKTAEEEPQTRGKVEVQPELPYHVLEFIWIPRRQIEGWRKEFRGNDLHNKVINTCVRFLTSHDNYQAGIITDTIDDLNYVVDTSMHVEVVQLFNISNKCFIPSEVHPELLRRVAEHQQAYVSPRRHNVFAHTS